MLTVAILIIPLVCAGGIYIAIVAGLIALQLWLTSWEI